MPRTPCAACRWPQSILQGGTCLPHFLLSSLFSILSFCRDLAGMAAPSRPQLYAAHSIADKVALVTGALPIADLTQCNACVVRPQEHRQW